MRRVDLDREMSELFSCRCSDSAVLVRRTHIFVGLAVALVGGVLLGVVIQNSILATLASLLFVSTLPLVADQRVLAMVDGSVVQAKWSQFRRKPTRQLPPLAPGDFEIRSARSSKNFELGIHDNIFIGQRGSDEFARALRSTRASGA